VVRDRNRKRSNACLDEDGDEDVGIKVGIRKIVLLGNNFKINLMSKYMVRKPTFAHKCIKVFII